jgi:hypothetical protein
MTSITRTFLLLALVFFGFASFPQAEHLNHYNNYYYEHPHLDRICKNHEKIAITPFCTSITHYASEMKRISFDEHKNLELEKGQDIQKEIYSYLSEKEDNGKLSVSVQDPDITNARLRSAGAVFEDINEYNPVELANVLEVDAIVMGYFKSYRPYTGFESFIDSKTSFEAIIMIRIFNAEDGLLLLGRNKYYEGGFLSSPEIMENRLLRKVVKKIPY